MQPFKNVAYSFVHPPAANPGMLVREALYSNDSRRGQLHRLVASSRGTHVAIFRSEADREFAINCQPLPAMEHTVTFQRHDETDNRFRFPHEGYVSLAIEDFPFEHWTKQGVRIAAGVMANPCQLSQICLQGLDFSAVLMVALYERVEYIPYELLVKNADGVGTVARVRQLRRWNIHHDDGDDHDDGGPRGDHGGGDGGAGGDRAGGDGPNGPGAYGGADRGGFGRGNEGCNVVANGGGNLSGAHGRGAADPRQAGCGVRLHLPSGPASVLAPAPPPNATQELPPLAIVSHAAFPPPRDVRVAISAGNIHVLVLGDQGELGYFRVPRVQPDAGYEEPFRMPSINLHTGVIGRVHNIFADPSGHSVTSSAILAEPRVSDNPLVDILAANPGMDPAAAILARTGSHVLLQDFSAVASGPTTAVDAAPLSAEATFDAALSTDAVMTAAAATAAVAEAATDAAAATATATGAAVVTSDAAAGTAAATDAAAATAAATDAAAVTAAAVTTAADAAPRLRKRAAPAAPTRCSLRLKGLEAPTFSTVMGLAESLKARKMGCSCAPSTSAAAPPLTSVEQWNFVLWPVDASSLVKLSRRSLMVPTKTMMRWTMTWCPILQNDRLLP
ncbi:hypothetical protein ACP4OV_026861 [Aristida adscensionis]